MNATLLRHVVLPGWQYATGQDSIKRLRELERTQWVSADALQDLQWRRLGDLLAHAATHVPYYARVMREIGADSGRMVRERSLEHLPLLEKATIKRHFDSLRATNVPPERFVPNGTGGSTGEPLRFFDDRAGLGSSDAAVWRSQRWLDVDVGERCAYLWGSSFDLSAFHGIVGRAKAAALNMTTLPAWELSKATAPTFWQRLYAFRPRLLVAYADALYQMARLLGPDRERVPGLRAVIVSAELLTEQMRRTIEACFKVPVYNRYGGRDIKFVAQECPVRDGLHVNAEHALVEIVQDGKRLPPGRVGEVVITRLDNFAMPFIRYRTGDVAALSSALCECGRSLPLLQKLEGRVQDAIRTSDGKIVSGLFFPHLFKDCPDVHAFQVHQMALHRVRILLELSEGAQFVSRPRVERLLREQVGADMAIEFEVCPKIPLAQSGKRRIVVSHLADEAPVDAAARSVP